MTEAEIIVAVAKYLDILRDPGIKESLMMTTKMSQEEFDEFTRLSTWEELWHNKILLACENPRKVREMISCHIQVWNRKAA